MASHLILHLFRAALPALISLALFIAPMACAQQCGVSSADKCATELFFEVGHGEEPAEGELEHQAHHCPNCHIQWSGPDGAAFAKTTAPETLNPPLLLGAGPSPPGSLFRPPRV